jgi:hypothetical protein
MAAFSVRGEPLYPSALREISADETRTTLARHDPDALLSTGESALHLLKTETIQTNCVAFSPQANYTD